MFKHLLYIIFFSISITSCINHQEDKIPIAKVYDKVLFFDDIKDFMPGQLNQEDSLLFVTSYINKWAKEQLLLKKAQINLREENENINTLVNQYRQDLLINKYKEAVVEQELDTLVTEDNIENFYNNNRDIFKLNEELVKFRYIYFGNEIINPKEFISLFKSDDDESDAKIISNELKLKSFNLNDSIWIKYDDVIKIASFIKDYDKDDFLRKNKFFQKEDSTGIYLVKVKDVLLRNDIAPMSYALPTIKQMILHRRKLELLRKIEKTITNDAIKNKEFQIY